MELSEVERLTTLDGRDEQLARTISLRKVDCDAKIDMFWMAERWLSIDFGEEGIHLRHRTKGLDHCETNEVSERDLATTSTFQVIVDDGSIVDQ